MISPFLSIKPPAAKRNGNSPVTRHKQAEHYVEERQKPVAAFSGFPVAGYHLDLFYGASSTLCLTNVGQNRLPQSVFTWVFQSSSCSQFARTPRILQINHDFGKRKDVATFWQRFEAIRRRFVICLFFDPQSVKKAWKFLIFSLQEAQGSSAKSSIVESG